MTVNRSKGRTWRPLSRGVLVFFCAVVTSVCTTAGIPKVKDCKRATRQCHRGAVVSPGRNGNIPETVRTSGVFADDVVDAKIGLPTLEGAVVRHC